MRWTLPPLDGMPIFRFGIEFFAPNRQAGRYEGRIALLDLDRTGAPQAFVQTGMLMTSIWNLSPRWLQAWVSSARHFAPDFKYTYCISHPEEGGVVTIGTRDWCNYAVRSAWPSLCTRQGDLSCVARATAATSCPISAGKQVSIVRRVDTAAHPGVNSFRLCRGPALRCALLRARC